MRDVLFVSKPVAPPWNDSNKNLVRDVAGGLRRYRARVMVPRDAPLPGVLSEPLYEGAGNFAPSRLANARVLARLVTGASADVWHFFFGPNPLTLHAGRLARAIRRVPTVHTIASAPDDLERIASALFADRVVALSSHTAARLARVGVSTTVIPPALAIPRVSATALSSARERHALPERYALFPGDLEFGDGARTFVAAAAREPGLGWVIASRPKTARAHAAREELRHAAQRAGAPVLFLGEVTDIHAVVAGASVVCLASNTLHAKMDWPLVLLEALALGVPVVVAAETPAADLAQSGAADLIRAGDDEALHARVAARMAASAEARAALAEGATAWVRKQCDPAVVAGAHEALYDELLAARA